MPKHKKLQTMRNAAEELAACGLLVAEDSVLRPAGKKLPERKVKWYRKAKWTEVTTSPAATEEIRRLELARNHFEL